MDGLKIDESLIPNIIGIVVAVIVVSVILIPITEEVTSTTDTYENDGAFYVTNKLPYSMTYSDGVCSINGVEYNPALNSEYSIAFSDQFAVRNYNGFMSRPVTLADISGVAVNDRYLVSLTVDENLNATLVRYNSYDDANVTDTFTLEYFWGMSPEKTDNVMTKGGIPTYVNSTDEMFTIGRSQITTWSNTFEVTGSIGSGADVLVIRPPTGITVSDIELNYTQVDNHEGYKIQNITFVATVDADSSTHDVTYDRMVAPASVTMDITNPTFNSVERAILNVLPIFVVLAILMGIVGLMYFNRNGQ